PDVMVGRQEVREGDRGQLVLVAKEVVVVDRERGSAERPAVARTEQTNELRVRGVECRLVTKSGHGRRAVVVLVMVVLGFDAEFRGHGPRSEERRVGKGVSAW